MTAFYPGTFSPITRGHIEIAANAAKKYGGCIIGVGYNSSKTPLFTSCKRVIMIEEALNFYKKYYLHDEQLDIRVVSYNELTVDTAINLGCTHIVRGSRGAKDDYEEERLAFINKRLLKIRGHKEIELVQMKSSPALAYVSSSDVIELCRIGEYILAQSYVLPPTHNELMKIYLASYFERLFPDSNWKEFVHYFDNRAYHNLSHIAYMLNRLHIYERQNGYCLDNVDDIARAIFLHDALDIVRDAAALSSNEFVAKLIYATDHFQTQPQDFSLEEAIIHDLDLSILFDSNNYSDYMRCIREENKSCSAEVYQDGRTKILNRLIEDINFTIFPPEYRTLAILQMTKEKNSLHRLP